MSARSPMPPALVEDVAQLLAQLEAIPMERRMEALAIAARIFCDGHLDDRPCVMQPADDCLTAFPCALCPVSGESGGQT